MGSSICPARQYQFRVQFSNEMTDAELERVEVLGEHGEVMLTRPVSGHAADLRFCVDIQSRYYFLKIYQKDGAFAATAPVWVE